MLERFMKAGTKNKRNWIYQFWIQNNHAVELTSNYMIDQRIGYINYNPVKAMIVSEPEHYYYSSCFRNGLEPLIPLTEL